MELHEGYINLSTIDLSLFKLLNNGVEKDPLILIDRLIQHYNAEIMNNCSSLKNNLDRNVLETFRSLLCSKYQLLYHSMKEESRRTFGAAVHNNEDIIASIKLMEDKSNLSILYDVIVLQMVLHCSMNCIEDHFVNFRQFCNNEVNSFYLKILDCFLQAMQLRTLFYGNENLEVYERLRILYIKDLSLWLKAKEEKEWQIFALIFPRIIAYFGPENVLPVLWQEIFNTLEDSKDLFAALCIIVDSCFQLKNEDVSRVYCDLCYSEDLWLAIISGLQSPVQQYRKQSLFLLKNIIQFVNTVCREDNNDTNGSRKISFICKESKDNEISMKMLTEKFFLVFEALEEKQQHLIIPTLTHVPTILKGCQEHLSHNCFNIVWIQIIFQRMLQHENNTVVKQGISYISQFDTFILDEEFCKLFISCLNNTFLYDCQTYQGESDILSDSVRLFSSGILQRQSTFFGNLLKILSETAWGPVPLFYTLKSLRLACDKVLEKNLLKDDDLYTIKTLVQKHLSIHSFILRSASQIELLKIMTSSTQQINSLISVVNALFEFSIGGVLVRGSVIWQIVTAWLKRVFTEKDATKFVASVCEKYSTEGMFLDLSPQKFAFMTVMLFDAKLIMTDKTCIAEQALTQWLSCLNGIDMRPYADFQQSVNALEYISHTVLLSGTDEKQTVHFVAGYIRTVLNFLLKNLKSTIFKQTYDSTMRYIDILISLLKNIHLFVPENHKKDYTQNFFAESVEILNNVGSYDSLTCLCALHVLHFCQDVIEIKSYPETVLNISDYKIPEYKTLNDSNTKGKVASDCYLLLAKITSKCIMKLSAIEAEWLKNTLHLFEMGGKEVIPDIACILQAIVNKKLEGHPEYRSDLESIFMMCWRHTFLDKRNALFWPSISNIIEVLVNSTFLAIPNSMNFINQFLDQLLEEGDSLPKLKKILLTKMDDLDPENLKKFQDVLISCLIHGSVLRRDKKIENQAYINICTSYTDYYPHNLLIVEHNIDATIRAHATLLLHRIIVAEPNFASEFLPEILKKLEKFSNKRYYNHSYVHKVKHRLMQVLLILQPMLNKATSIELQEVLCSFLLSESNQHSVRLMQEWILIRIFKENINLHENLWKFFEEGILNRPGCTSSIITIVYHVALLLPVDIQGSFISTGLKYISRCCLGQQFSMRLYGQVTFVKLYKLLQDINTLDIVLEYKGLYNVTLESLKEGNLMKNSIKMQNDFYLTIFHPLNNYTLETIYSELPRLTDMDIDEQIQPDLFKALNFKESVNHPLKILDTNPLLSNVSESPYLGSPSSERTDLAKCHPDTSVHGLSDVQKKIDVLTISPLYHDIQESRKKNNLSEDEGLIVVASFIDRAPNLGGLARTCEIFSAKELVISNLSLIKDREFQSLSVSADKWITITEVKPHQIQEYLLKRKEMGWSLVGVEQTAYSTNLLDMTFNKKTVLILGNEKNGVPANLIPLFDTCIEIPQTGVIRSLNVHVTGAICIWQYAKQHILV